MSPTRPEEMDELNDYPGANQVLLHSFLLVAGAYMLNLICMGAAAMLLALTLFPKTMLIFDEPEKFKAAFQADPESIFRPEMMWILLGVSALVSFGLGYFVARQARLSKFPHAIFFAVILFGQYLQLAIGAIPLLQTILILFMAISPIAALLGANMYLTRMDPNTD